MMSVLGHAALDQVVSHQLRNSGVGAQTDSAGHYDRRQSLAKQFRGARGAVGVKIVVAQNDDGVGVFQRIFDD